jgi:hypothetical protein
LGMPINRTAPFGFISNVSSSVSYEKEGETNGLDVAINNDGCGVQITN